MDCYERLKTLYKSPSSLSYFAITRLQDRFGSCGLIRQLSPNTACSITLTALTFFDLRGRSSVNHVSRWAVSSRSCTSTCSGEYRKIWGVVSWIGIFYGASQEWRFFSRVARLTVENTNYVKQYNSRSCHELFEFLNNTNRRIWLSQERSTDETLLLLRILGALFHHPRDSIKSKIPTQ